MTDTLTTINLSSTDVSQYADGLSSSWSMSAATIILITG